MKKDNIKTRLKAAIVQHPPIYLNLNESISRACDYIEEAANNGANIIVFPETWLPGYPIWFDFAPGAALWDSKPAKALFKILADNSLEIPSDHMDQLLSIAGKTNTYVIIGANEKAGNTIYNTIVLIDKNGKDFKIHRKLVPTYTERLVWGRGDGSTLNVMESEFGNIGALVCWEHWMPLARAAMHSQNEIIHIAQWPSARELHQVASRHYAFEGQCFVLAAGTVMSWKDIIEGYNSLNLKNNSAIEILEQIPHDDNNLPMYGGSSVIAPDISYVTEPVFEKACIVYGDIDTTMIKEGHLVMDSDGHYSRPDIFHLEVNTAPQTNVSFKNENKPEK